MRNHISHVEVSGTNPDQLREFYGQVFDWQIQHMPEMQYNMVDGSPSIGIGSSPENPYVTFYVDVDDLQATLDKAEAAGGKTIMPPMEIPGTVKMAMFADPEGHFIGITSPIN